MVATYIIHFERPNKQGKSYNISDAQILRCTPVLRYIFLE